MPQLPEIPPVDNDIEKSIEIISRCRDIHIRWIDKIKEGKKTKVQIKVGGGVCWHKKWVRDYNFVIKTLKNGML